MFYRYFFNKRFAMFSNTIAEAVKFTKNNFLRLFFLTLQATILVYIYLFLSEFILNEYELFYDSPLTIDIFRIYFINSLIITYLYSPIIVRYIRGVSLSEKPKYNYIEHLFSNTSSQTYLILAALIVLSSSLFSLTILIWPTLLKIPRNYFSLIIYIIFASSIIYKILYIFSKLNLYLASKACDDSIYFENSWGLINKKKTKFLAFTIFTLLILLIINSVIAPIETLFDNFTNLNKYLVIFIKVVIAAFGLTIMGTFWGIVGGFYKYSTNQD